MSLFPDPLKAVSQARQAIGSVLKGKPKAAIQHVAGGVNAIAGSQVIQAVFPVQAIPKAIIAGAVQGGKKGALAAAQNSLKNPVLKAMYGAVGLAFPPFAPLSAGTIAGMEASSRLLDAYESKNAKEAAAAAMQLAATAQKVKEGDPGAARAMQSITEVGKARELLEDFEKGAPAAVAAVKAMKSSAERGDARAKAGMYLFQAVATRAAQKGVPTKPKIRIAHEAPTMVSLVSAAMRSPSGVRLGGFSVLSTGRILYKGKGVRKR
jgi:hypothetical protein